MIFGSDNWAGAAPDISESLANQANRLIPAYGESDYDNAVYKRFREVFETDLSVFYVATGTAANSLAIASAMEPGGIVFCHDEAHIFANEGGAPEFLSAGGRLHRVAGPRGKIDTGQLARAAHDYPKAFNHLGQGVMVSITQASEAGTVYGLQELSAIKEVASEHDLIVHMDGARFANALVHLNCTPAEMTWKSGIDMVSFGATKNGCWCAEALLVFDPIKSRKIKFLRKRMGHLFSKSWFVSAQFDAYFDNDLWMKLANHANAIGAKLEQMVGECNAVRLAWKSDSNQVFFVAKKETAEKWIAEGARFHPFPTPQDLHGKVGQDECVYRLVASFASTNSQVADLEQIFRKG